MKAKKVLKPAAAAAVIGAAVAGVTACVRSVDSSPKAGETNEERGIGRANPYCAFKRLFDVVASTLGIVGTSPFWLAGVIGIKIQDPGPVFYTAHRVGKDNREFKMLKFRSMRIDREADESSFRADEDRIFPWGRFMRDSKIDELPQLLNVLNGTMSIIGPRPASVDQAAITRSGRNAIVGEVPCGLSGPSALYDYIVGDAVTDEAEYEEKVLPTRLALDVYYVKNMGAVYDLKMIGWTIESIVMMMGGKIPQKILDELLESASEAGLENGSEPYAGERDHNVLGNIAYVTAVEID